MIWVILTPRAGFIDIIISTAAAVITPYGMIVCGFCLVMRFLPFLSCLVDILRVRDIHTCRAMDIIHTWIGYFFSYVLQKEYCLLACRLGTPTNPIKLRLRFTHNGGGRSSRWRWTTWQDSSTRGYRKSHIPNREILRSWPPFDSGNTARGNTGIIPLALTPVHVSFPRREEASTTCLFYLLGSPSSIRTGHMQVGKLQLKKLV